MLKWFRNIFQVESKEKQEKYSNLEMEVARNLNHNVKIKSPKSNKINSLKDLIKYCEDDFHLLLRKKGVMEFHDYDINLYNEKILPKNYASVFYKKNDRWYDLVIEGDIFVSLNEEPVGLQMEFENANLNKALQIADEMLSNIEDITKEEGEIWLIVNDSIISL